MEKVWATCLNKNTLSVCNLSSNAQFRKSVTPTPKVSSPSKVSMRNSPSSDSSISERVSESVYLVEFSEDTTLASEGYVAQLSEQVDGGGII
jgi:hypothetical protein